GTRRRPRSGRGARSPCDRCSIAISRWPCPWYTVGPRCRPAPGWRSLRTPRVALDVLLELSLRHELHREQHPAVVGAAQLGAPADEHARPVERLDLETVDDVAREEVLLEEEGGHPEGVDDVVGVKLELNLGVDRQHELRTLRVLVALLAQVHRDAGDLDLLALVVRGELPAPLVAVHPHLDRGRPRDLHDLGLVPRGEEEEDRHHDHGDHGVEDLDRQVVANLRRQRFGVPLLTVERDRPEDEAPDDDTGGESRDPRAIPQRLDDLGLLGDALRHAPAGPLIDRLVAARRRARRNQRHGCGTGQPAALRLSPCRTAGRTHGSPTPQTKAQEPPPGRFSYPARGVQGRDHPAGPLYSIEFTLGETLAWTSRASLSSPRLM